MGWSKSRRSRVNSRVKERHVSSNGETLKVTQTKIISSDFVKDINNFSSRPPEESKGSLIFRYT